MGIALNGVPIMRALSELNYDAFYPIAHSTYKNPIAILPDNCLGSNDYNSFYHYYTFTPCIVTAAAKGGNSMSSCASNSYCYSDILNY